MSRLCNRHLFVHSFTSREFCYTFYRCPHRLAAKDATLSRWISRVRIPLGAPFDAYPDLLRRGSGFFVIRGGFSGRIAACLPCRWTRDFIRIEGGILHNERSSDCARRRIRRASYRCFLGEYSARSRPLYLADNGVGAVAGGARRCYRVRGGGGVPVAWNAGLAGVCRFWQRHRFYCWPYGRLCGAFCWAPR